LKDRIARVLFAVEDGEMVLAHGFIKKAQTAPIDLELARTRLNDLPRKEQSDGQEEESPPRLKVRGLSRRSGACSKRSTPRLPSACWSGQLSQAMKRSSASPSPRSPSAWEPARAALDRLLDADNASVTLQTMGRAAAALGKQITISFQGRGCSPKSAYVPSAGIRSCDGRPVMKLLLASLAVLSAARSLCRRQAACRGPRRRRRPLNYSVSAQPRLSQCARDRRDQRAYGTRSPISPAADQVAPERNLHADGQAPAPCSRRLPPPRRRPRNGEAERPWPAIDTKINALYGRRARVRPGRG